jgi:cytochrome c peroxidase
MPGQRPVSAIRGFQVFVGDGRCVACHFGPRFSDDEFHNLGVPAIGTPPSVDDGRFRDVHGLLNATLGGDPIDVALRSPLP